LRGRWRSAKAQGHSELFLQAELALHAALAAQNAGIAAERPFFTEGKIEEDPFRRTAMKGIYQRGNGGIKYTLIGREFADVNSRPGPDAASPSLPDRASGDRPKEGLFEDQEIG
jgi:hypothetical protein